MADEETTETTSEEETTTSTEEETASTETTKGEDWKAHSRKHEREAKAARKRAEELEAKLKEREEADQSEHEKALAKAREEARAEALTESQKERRHDRLESKSAVIASKGITVKDGDETKTLKFADPDDALIYLERAIKDGDVDEDDIFDSEGKVQTDALSNALKDILERKPHLQATNGTTAVVSGSADGGKGGGAGKDEESLSVGDRFERLQKK